MREKSLRTRAQIIAAAERAFAEEGLEKASLAQINRDAGQKNKSSLQYHFKNREGLLRAIRDKHREAIDEDRRALLEKAEAGGELRLVVEALVMPLANKLDDPDGGVHYIRMMALDRTRPKPSLREVRPVTARALALLNELTPKIPGPEARARQILVFGLMFHGLADFSRQYPIRRRAKSYEKDREVFVRSLVDAVVAILESPTV